MGRQESISEGGGNEDRARSCKGAVKELLNSSKVIRKEVQRSCKGAIQDLLRICKGAVKELYMRNLFIYQAK